jgi:hypothetical protein
MNPRVAASGLASVNHAEIRAQGNVCTYNGYIGLFPSMNPALQHCEPERLAAVGLENLLAGGDLI